MEVKGWGWKDKWVKEKRKGRRSGSVCECIFFGEDGVFWVIVCVGIYVSTCLNVSLGLWKSAGRRRSVLFIHRVGEAQETANRSFLGKKSKGRSLRFYRRKWDWWGGVLMEAASKTGMLEVELPTGNKTFYMCIISQGGLVFSGMTAWPKKRDTEHPTNSEQSFNSSIHPSISWNA